ncbi:PEPxxWA-CTERM sorting domain-containing protein [Qipengyuania sp. DGS5-3]|uniref:PEPxxWA-CTERM sorting domain-containing protein n=1 Tax=Qipengyuania sp. DGS5-3 TaxID=3349632 RepID=UPI0036D38E28
MKKLLLAGAALATMTSPAHAAATIFFGENQNPGGAVSGDPETARNDFLSNLSAGVNTEDFEGLATGAPPLPLVFNGGLGPITATLTGTGNLRGSPTVGTFATSGSQYYDNVFDSFTISFDTAIAAFGFYGTDIGDVNESLEITIDAGLASERMFTVANTVGGNDGSLLFWGITDTANPFTTVSFAQSGSDRFGFDDLTIGDVSQVTGGVPEPGTWAMMLLGFFGLGAAMRRKPETTTRVRYV